MKILLIMTMFLLVLCVLGSRGKKPSCEEIIKGSPDDVHCSPRGGMIYLINPMSLSRNEAEMKCREKHGHLVSGLDVPEASFLQSILKERNIVSAWTAVYDRGDGDFGLAFTGAANVLNVLEEENEDNTEDCTTLEDEPISQENLFCLRSQPCNGPFASICKINYFEGSKLFIPAALPDVEDLTNDLKRTWDGAKVECEEIKGGQLVTIDSVRKNLYLTDLLQNKYSSQGNYGILGAWIGLRYNGECRKFQWSSGSYSVYRKWCSGQPNLPDVTPGQTSADECVSFFAPDFNAMTRTQPKGCLTVEAKMCDEKALYVCEKKCAQKEDALHDLTTVIRQQISRLRGQCKSCNKHGHLG